MELPRITVPKMIRSSLRIIPGMALSPLLLFISTTNTLFVKNAAEFANDVHVLEQFVIYALIAFILGLALLLAAHFLKPAIASLPFWLYILAGPFFLVYAFLHVRRPEVMDNPFACIAFALVYLLLAGLLSRRGKLEVALTVFSHLFVVFFLIEAFIFAGNRESRDGTIEDDSETPPLREAQIKRPNIYHIVFDQYATELFEHVLNPELRSRLAGFQYFPENITPYSGTRISVPSVFHGHPISWAATKESYDTEAFSTEKSFLHWLVEAGYDTSAFMSVDYWSQSEYRLFRHKRAFLDYADASYAVHGGREFRALWLYAHFPAFLVRKFVSARTVHELRYSPVLPQFQPVTSHFGFLRFLREEERLPDYGRYTFMHLMLPHGPYVLRRDGSYGPPLEDGSLPETSLMEQTYCATELLLQFIECLSKLGRFENSMVIIHADHGARAADKGAELCLSGIPHVVSRSRALLLLKLPGRDGSLPFEISNLETSLLDLAPTVLDAVGIQSAVSYPGLPLTQLERIPTDRDRLYVYYNEQEGWDPQSAVHYLVRGYRYTNVASGNLLLYPSLTRDERRYFDGQEPVSHIQHGGFEHFPADAKFPTGWGASLEGPRCDPDDTMVRFGKLSLKLTGIPDERNRPKNIRALTAPSIEELQGREVVFGAWLYTANPEKVKIFIIDSWERYASAQPRKANEWQLVVQRAVIAPDATQVQFVISILDEGLSRTVCHVDGAALLIHE